MSEFLEHVEDPMAFLRFVATHLRDGGLFYDGVGREFTHEVYQKHLKEAKDVVESESYQQFHRDRFDHVDGNFYRKC